MQHAAETMLKGTESTTSGQLARFFPEVIAVQFQDWSTVVAAQALNGQFSWVSRP